MRYHNVPRGQQTVINYSEHIFEYDIENFYSFITKLNDTRNPLSRFLRGYFSPATLLKINDPYLSENVPQDVKDSILLDINNLIDNDEALSKLREDSGIPSHCRILNSKVNLWSKYVNEYSKKLWVKSIFSVFYDPEVRSSAAITSASFCGANLADDTWGLIHTSSKDNLTNFGQEAKSDSGVGEGNARGWTMTSINGVITINVPRKAKKGVYRGNIRESSQRPRKDYCRHIELEVIEEENTFFSLDPASRCFMINEESVEYSSEDDFPPYLWWVKNQWVGRSVAPTNPSIYYLTRTISNGKLSYCTPRVDRFTLRNYGFIWANGSYSMSNGDICRHYEIYSPENSLPSFLDWDNVKLNWKPNFGVTSLAEYKLVKTVVGNKTIYTPDLDELPYNINESNSCIEYGGRYLWKTRSNPLPILIYNPEINKFTFDKSLLLERCNFSTLSPYVYYDAGKWIESSIEPLGNNVFWGASFDDGVNIGYSFTSPLPYDAKDWYSRGIEKGEGQSDEWNIINIGEPIFIYRDKKYVSYSVTNLTEKSLRYQDYPTSIKLLNLCWLNPTQVTEVSPDLSKDPESPELKYSISNGFTLPYDTSLWPEKGLMLKKDDSLCVSPIEQPIFLYIPEKNSFCIRKSFIYCKYGLDYSQFLPSYLSWNLKCWGVTNQIPTGGTYLQKDESDPEWIKYTLVGASWPYNVNDWSNRGLSVGGDEWCITEVDPPFFVWDANCGCFCISRDYLERKWGFSEYSTLPLYLIWNVNSECWTPSNTPSGIYLQLQIKEYKVCYSLPEGGSLPVGYSTGMTPAILMGGSGEWCPTSIEAPIFQWQGNCYCIDLRTLFEQFGIDPDSLFKYLIWDGECWITSNTKQTGKAYLELKITSNKVCYCLPPGITELPYNPSTPYPGSGLKMNWGGRACPVASFPPYDFALCPIIRFKGFKVIRGKMVNGVFRPCDAINGFEAFESMPEGTKWSIINLPRHSELPIRGIKLIDNNINDRLEKEDKIYSTVWYREVKGNSNPSGSFNFGNKKFGTSDFGKKGAQKTTEELLSSFNQRIEYDRIEKVSSVNYNDYEFLVLVSPKSPPEKLERPSIFKVY